MKISSNQKRLNKQLNSDAFLNFSFTWILYN